MTPPSGLARHRIFAEIDESLPTIVSMLEQALGAAEDSGGAKEEGKEGNFCLQKNEPKGKSLRLRNICIRRIRLRFNSFKKIIVEEEKLLNSFRLVLLKLPMSFSSTPFMMPNTKRDLSNHQKRLI